MGLFGALVGVVWKAAVLFSSAVGALWERSLTPLVWLLGVLWGWLLFVGLAAAAVLLNLLGVDDVAETLHRRLPSDDGAGTDPVERVRDIPSETVTDEAGRFSPEAFATATGMTPAEFVHLYVTSKGGRVRQGTLTACLPWSKATVSRLLDTLENENAVERVDAGRENVVCTPETVPD